ncbi:MAG: MFS transporter [Candidatus Woesearchaeota archaeon]
MHGYFAKSGSIDSLGLVISGILGAFLVKQFGVSVVWIAAGISCFITFLLLSFAKEHFVKRNVKIKDSFKNIKKQSLISVRYAKNHSVLFLFLIAGAILVFATVFNGDLAWVTFMQELNFPEYAFGYMWSAMGVVGIFAPLISLKLMKKGKERKFILSILILTVLFLLLILFVESIAFAFLVLLSSIFFGRMSSPAERVYFHRFIKSKLRATVGSVESMLIGLIGIIALPLAGLSVDYLGARYTILLSALLMIPAAIIFFKIKDEKKQNTA